MAANQHRHLTYWHSNFQLHACFHTAVSFSMMSAAMLFVLGGEYSDVIVDWWRKYVLFS
jgi:hypothetical protein